MTLLFRTPTTGAPGVTHSVVTFPSTTLDVEEIADAISRWLDSEAMTVLLRRFARELGAGTVEERLAEAELLTRDVFDFRAGGERWEAREVDVDQETVEAIEAAVSWWFREPDDDLGPVSNALVLGGRINSCVLRAELLAALVSDGLRPGAVWGLGSHRPADEKERAVAVGLGQGAIDDELDAMCAALSWAFERGPASAVEQGVRRWADITPAMAGLAAEAPEGARRATTSDTYRFFRATCDTLTADDHLLVVTSAIHAPFQHAQALGELSLPTGARITTVGAHLGTSSEPLIRDRWTPGEWLQEIRSAVWSLQKMYGLLTRARPSALR